MPIKGGYILANILWVVVVVLFVLRLLGFLVVHITGGLIHLLPFCLKCDTQIHPEIGHIDALGQKTRYACDNDNCGNQVLLDGSHEQIVDRVSRQIQRKLRSSGEEWKTAIRTQG